MATPEEIKHLLIVYANIRTIKPLQLHALAMKQVHVDHLWLVSCGSLQFLTAAPLWLTKDYKWASIISGISASWVILLLLLVTVTHVKHKRECCYPDHIEVLTLKPCDEPDSDINYEPGRLSCSLGSLPDYALGIMVILLVTVHAILYTWRCIEQSPLFIQINKKYLPWFFATPEAFIFGIPMLIVRGDKKITRMMRICMVLALASLFMYILIFEPANKEWGCYAKGTPLAGLDKGTCNNKNSQIPNRRKTPTIGEGGLVCLLVFFSLIIVYAIVYVYDAREAVSIMEADDRLLELTALTMGIDPSTSNKDSRRLATQIEDLV